MNFFAFTLNSFDSKLPFPVLFTLLTLYKVVILDKYSESNNLNTLLLLLLLLLFFGGGEVVRLKCGTLEFPWLKLLPVRSIVADTMKVPNFHELTNVP